MKPSYIKKIESARKKLSESLRNLETAKDHRVFFKPVWAALNRLIRAWLVKNGWDWKKGSTRYDIEHLFQISAPRELRRKVSLIQHKLRHLPYNEPYSHRLCKNTKLDELEWKMETEACLRELSTLVDFVDTGFPPLVDFRGEFFQAFHPGQRVMSYFLDSSWKREKVWYAQLGTVLLINDRRINILWESRTISSTEVDFNSLEPVDCPLQDMDTPSQRRGTWFDLHPEHRQNPLHPLKLWDFNHSLFYTCPCCRYPILNIHPHLNCPDDDEPGAHEICLLCDWADDIQYKFEDIDAFKGDCNFDYSLKEARNNFEKYSCMFRPGHEPFFRINNLPHILALKKKLRLHFDQMIGKTKGWGAYLSWHSAQKARSELADAIKSEENKVLEYNTMACDDEGFPIGRIFSYKWKWGKTFYVLGQWHKNYIYGKAKIIWYGHSGYSLSLITRHIPLNHFTTSHVSSVLERIDRPCDDETTPLALRRNWFDLHPDVSLKKYTCPCCGFPTHEKPMAQEVCFLCGWTYDQQDDFDAAVILNQANGNYSLLQARKNFENHHCMFSPDDPITLVRYHLSPEILPYKSLITKTFYEILECNKPDFVKKYWDVIHALREKLAQHNADM